MANIIKKYIDIIVNNSKANKQLDETNKKLEDLSDSQKDLSKSTEGSSDSLFSFSGLMNKLPASITGAVAAVTAFVTATYALVSAQKQVAKELKLVSNITQLQGDAALDASAAAKTLAQTYGKDFNEVLVATNNLSKQFGISFKEATDIIENGFINGADATGNFLNQVTEYSSVISKAGYDANQFVAIIGQQIKGGIYDDKLIDAIKNFNIEIKDTTKIYTTLAQTFDTGFVTSFVNDVRTGAITSAEALVRLTKEANTLKLSEEELQKITSDLFTGAGEDAGNFNEIVKQINTALNSTNKELTEQQRIEKENLAIQEEYNKQLDAFLKNTSVVKDIWNSIGNLAITAVAGTLAEINKLFDTAEDRAAKLTEGYTGRGAVTGSSVEEINRQIEATKKLISEKQDELNQLNWFTESNRRAQVIAEIDTQTKDLEVLNIQLEERNKLEAEFRKIQNQPQRVSKEQNIKDLAFYKELKNLSREAAKAAAEDRLAELDVVKTVEETKLELLNDRFNKEMELTKKSYDNQIAIAQSTAIELIKGELGIRAEQELTKEQYIQGRKIIEQAAKAGNEDARKRFLDLVASENAAADARRDKAIELAALDKKYAEEQFTRYKRLTNIEDEREAIRLDNAESRLQIELENTNELSDQLKVNNRLYKVEEARLDLKKQSIALDLKKKVDTAEGLAIAKELDALAKRKDIIDASAKAVDALLIKQQELNTINRTTDAERFNVVLKERNSLFDKAVELAAKSDTITGDGVVAILNKVKDGTTKVVDVASESLSVLTTRMEETSKKMAEIATASLEEAASGIYGTEIATEAKAALEKDAAERIELAKKTTASEISLYKAAQDDKIALLEEYLREVERIEEDITNTITKEIRGRSKALRNSIKDDVLSLRFGTIFKDISELSKLAFEREKRIQTEILGNLREQADIRQQLAIETAKSELAEILKVRGFDLSTAEERIKELVAIEERYKGDKEKIIEELGKSVENLSDEELATILKLNNDKLDAEQDYIQKREDLFRTDQQIRLDLAKKTFSDINEVASSVANAYTEVDNLIQQFEQQRIDSLNSQIELINERIAQVEDLISQAEARLGDLESDLSDARGERREQLLRRYEAEKNAVANLQREEAKLAEDRARREKELADIQEKQAKRQRQLATINQFAATAQLAAGAAEAFGQASKVPYPANLVAIATTIAAVVSAIGTLKSATQSFEEGGSVDGSNGGFVEGSRHSEGGIPMLVKTRPGDSLEMEGGEYIFSRKAVQRIGKDKLDMMNFNNMSPILNKSSFEEGGIVSSTNNSPAPIINLRTEDLNSRMNQMIEATNKLANRPVIVETVPLLGELNNVNSAKTVSIF